MKKIKLLPLFLCLFLLSGCWSAREIHQISIVLGLGVDKAEGENIEVLVQVAVPSNIGSKKNGGSENKKYLNFIMKEKDIVTAMRNTSKKSGFTLSLSHNIIILIGRKAAEEGIYKYLDYLIRNSELRLNMALVIADGDIKDILDTKSEILKVPGEYIKSLIDMQKKTVGGDIFRILDFANILMEKSRGCILPMVKIDKESDPPALVIDEAAVFQGDKMIGKVSMDTVRGIMLIKDEIEGGTISAGKDDSIGYKVDSSKTKLSVKTDNGISIDINIKTDLHALVDNNNLLKINGLDKEKEEVENKIKMQVINSIDVAKALGVDVFGFGEKIYKKDPKYWNSIKDKWGEKFQEISPTVTVTCNIEGSGLISETVLNEREDE